MRSVHPESLFCLSRCIPDRFERNYPAKPGSFPRKAGFLPLLPAESADAGKSSLSGPCSAIPWRAENTAEQYDSSYVNDWLNNYFYPKLKNKEYLVKQTWCSETTTSSSSARTTCSNNLSTTPQYVGLLSLDEYNLAGGTNSYLDIAQYQWTMTPYSSSSARSVSNNGYANYSSVTGTRGLRAVINVNSDVTITGGNGTWSNPYQI